jgi:hypothetical protein
MKPAQLLLAAAIFGLILFALFGGGAFLLVRNVPMVAEGWQSKSWPSAMAQVRESAAVSIPMITDARRGAVGTHIVKLRYEFTMDSKTFVGTRQSLDDVGKVKYEDVAQREASSMPVGSAIRVFYDPGNPSRSLLTPGVPISGVISVVFGLVLIAAGAGLVAVGLHLGAHHAKRRKVLRS